MYQALYRKFRPQTFGDVVGQSHIVTVLKNQLKSGKVGHAYLFCGSRGTGKTTCAKLLAKAVNCEALEDGNPCNKCASCRAIDSQTTLDVMEIDAAGNNGVDNIRSLCEEVKFMPADLKKRVYIIDEVHMLTIAAFNALLKTLEEPPEHVLFILATTEMQKVPATIISRCQRFDFRRISPEIITDRLMRISSKEGISIEREAAAIIARLSDGAMRDALSLLEACAGKAGVITPDEITAILGLSDREILIDLCEACIKSNPSRCMALISELYEKSSDLKASLNEIIKLYRDITVIKSVPSPRMLIDCSETEYKMLCDIASAASESELIYQLSVLQPLVSGYDYLSSGKRASVELAFIRMCHPQSQPTASLDALSARIDKLESRLDGGGYEAAPKLPSDKGEKAEKIAPKQKIAAEESKQAPSVSSGTYPESRRLLQSLKGEAIIYPYLESAKFICRDQNTLAVLTESFTNGILSYMKAEDIILRYVKNITPEITAVRLESEQRKKEPDAIDSL